MGTPLKSPSSPKTVLFVPVSGPSGAGEYYRCLTVAEALARRHPRLRLHFCLNRHAAAMRPEGFEYHLLKDTPTLDVEAVERIMETLCPDMVVFDNTLRTRHLKKAKQVGAAIIYTSSRPRKRRKGFALHKLRYIDQHWVIAPPFQHRLSFYERAALHLAKARGPGFVAAVLPEPDNQRLESLLAPYSFPLQGYTLFVSGGGGGTMNGIPTADVFQQAARRYHKQTGEPTLLVSGPLSGNGLESDHHRLELRAVSPGSLSDLIAGSMLVVSGGGSTAMHALSLEKPCLAVPAGGKDQPVRIRQLAGENALATCRPDAKSIAEASVCLAKDGEHRRQLSESAREKGFVNGLGRMVLAFEHVLSIADKS